MKEVQPICVIYLPTESYPYETFKSAKPFQLMNEFNGWNNPERIREPLGGYLWFCFYKDSITEPEFKVFYEKDWDEIGFEELKKLVTDSINKNAE
jgi:hypothetical protein